MLLIISGQLKRNSVTVWRCNEQLVYLEMKACMWRKSKGNIFFREGLACFSKTMLILKTMDATAEQHTPVFINAWLHRRRVLVLNRPAFRSRQKAFEALLQNKKKGKTQDCWVAPTVAPIVYWTKNSCNWSQTCRYVYELLSQPCPNVFVMSCYHQNIFFLFFATQSSIFIHTFQCPNFFGTGIILCCYKLKMSSI